ncbi:hypothetical protein G0Q06_01375 [Puniceicoccales bacterium CK1056]|uniref:Uncharacterized protein n=1 Tax=Oceanipulchritudo coccoides TaxID=2706888 RepID=A0A6B2LXS2_9BACT|nr:hypothetical protein [Oceanipulchritudo coccoides]NDV61093.1 hypothetical protein [Oceanipulchritudo coccoides]
MNITIKILITALALLGLGAITGPILAAVAGAGAWILIPFTIASGAALLFTGAMFLKHFNEFRRCPR